MRASTRGVHKPSSLGQRVRVRSEHETGRASAHARPHDGRRTALAPSYVHVRLEFEARLHLGPLQGERAGEGGRGGESAIGYIKRLLFGVYLL